MRLFLTTLRYKSFNLQVYEASAMKIKLHHEIGGEADRKMSTALSQAAIKKDWYVKRPRKSYYAQLGS